MELVFRVGDRGLREILTFHGDDGLMYEGWTVSPWPFRILNDTSLTSYITKDGPAYQIDFWDAPSRNQMGY
jgi:hypothetical protein